MKAVSGLVVSGLPLVAYLALPNCTTSETRPTNVSLRLKRSHPELPYARPPVHQSISSEVAGVDGEVRLTWGLTPRDPIPTKILWHLTVVPPDAGQLWFPDGLADLAHDPVAADGITTARFHVTFEVDPAFEGNAVTLAGTASLDNSPTVASATLDIPIAARGPAPGPPASPGLQITCQRDPSEGQAPLTVEFSARATGCAGACAVTWEFGDGARADGLQATHVYDRAGEYDAVGVDHDGDDVANCVKTVVVKAPEPRAGPSPAPTAPSSGRPGGRNVIPDIDAPRPRR